jgi:histidinol phosphatase-like PHP family hydrolase
LRHLELIEEAGKIVKINDRPKRYRKSEKDKESLESKGLELGRSEIREPVPKLLENI